VKKETVDFSALATSQSTGTGSGSGSTTGATLTIGTGSSTAITVTSSGEVASGTTIVSGTSLSAPQSGSLVITYTPSGSMIATTEAVFSASGQARFSSTIMQQSTLTTASGSFSMLYEDQLGNTGSGVVMDEIDNSVLMGGTLIQSLFTSGVAYVDNNYILTAGSNLTPYTLSYALVGGEGREDFSTTGSTPVFYYYLKDHLGSTRAVWSPSLGQLTEATGYLPFGTQVSIISTAGENTREKFTGKELDNDGAGAIDAADPSNAVTGMQLSYFGGRYLDGLVGKWISTDPAGQFFDEYSYGGNNPINGTDPNGLLTILNADGSVAFHVDEPDGSAGEVWASNGQFRTLLPLNEDDFNEFAAVVYGEGTNNIDELSGIASVIENRSNLSGRWEWDIIESTGFDAYDGTKYNSVVNNFDNSNAYFSNARGAVINTLIGGQDYSNSSYFFSATSNLSNPNYSYNLTSDGGIRIYSITVNIGGTTFLNYNSVNPTYGNHIWP
jgi:RHS repeat-associated protein